MHDAASGSAFSFFMGGSTSGKNVNERSAMQMTAVYACVRILSEAVAGLLAAIENIPPPLVKIHLTLTPMSAF